MALENILEVLSLEMEGVKLDRETLFENKDLILGYRTVLSNFPEIVKVVKSPTIMHKYLQLSPEDKEKVSTFTKENSDYIVGKGDLSGRNLRSIFDRNKFSENAKEIIRLNNGINVVQQAFTYYLENRKIGDITPFGPYYFQNKNLKKKFNNFYSNSHRYFKSKGGFKYLLDFVEKENLEIRNYLDKKNLTLVDSQILIQEAFKHYLENREIGDLKFFTSEYFKNDKLKEDLDNRFKKFFEKSNYHFKKEGGLKYLFDLSEKKNPEINIYRNKISLILVDSPALIEQAFNHYLENRKIGDSNIFDQSYFQKVKLKKKFKNKFLNFYERSRKDFRKNGGLVYLLNLVCEKNSEIGNYMDSKSLILIDSQILIQEAFNHYLKNRNQGDSTYFGPSYFKKINESTINSRNKFIKFYQRACTYFKNDGGFSYLLSQVIDENPQIYDYLHHKTKKSIDKLRSEI